jgi:multicomponent Na+:H+ antiporter subunit A
MLTAVLSGFVLAALAPWIHRLAGRRTGWILALLPFGLMTYFISLSGPVLGGEALREIHSWAPSLGLDLSFHLDGLALLFVLLISGIGGLVVVYSGSYLEGHPQAGRFHAYILAFMASMLGVVTADNVLALYVFWELTGLTSYFLIGFEHERKAAREAALSALLVTTAGGLALLAGLLLMGSAGGSMDISGLASQADVLRGHALYPAILALVLAGAFTKSAQFPFHFWLPAAMEAPTPVSAYLHSATMVKAGVYLLARLSPVLGGGPGWFPALAVAGAVTAAGGAWLALVQTDLKLLLAYATVSALGVMTALLGIGNEAAVAAAMAFLAAHALYKGGLFLVSGIVDHKTGERDATRLSGLGRTMPVTAAAAILAALSMAGVPLFAGFAAKERVLEAVLETGRLPPISTLILAALVPAGAAYVAVAVTVGVRPFLGRRAPTPKEPHRPSAALWLGPLLLAALGLAAGIVHVPFAGLVAPAASAILSRPAALDLAIWHGITPALGLGVLVLGLGVWIYTVRGRLLHLRSRFPRPASWGPAAWYRSGLAGLMALANRQTRLIQSGYLRYYLLTVIAATGALAGHVLLTRMPLAWDLPPTDLRFYELALAAVVLLAALAAVRSRSRLGAVASLGMVAYGVALLFLLYGAPDLAMVQFVIETVTVVLFVLALYHLPVYSVVSSGRARLRDAAAALAAGGLMTVLLLAATNARQFPAISDFYAAHSVPEGHGRNVVNVILVDFRALDTLGEIAVLAVAGAGAYALLKLRIGRGDGE